MAQSTSHPDCVHCRFMVRKKNGEYECRQHAMVLHTPVSLFCKLITPVDDDDSDYQQWFEQAFAETELDPNTLYTWIETTIRDRAGMTTTHIDIASIAPLTIYSTWSAGSFWQTLRQLRSDQRLRYRRKGFKLD
ncbi:MAG: hypothetical protein ACFE0Q_11895 [Anaerolineae bacterium]